MRAIISMAAFCLVIASPAKAIRPDECEQQRAAFPKEWNDVSKEKPLFFCWSHYSGAFKVTLGAGDKEGRRLMSLVPLSANDKKAKQDTSKDVFRIWLDREQTRRLEDGKYFATIVRQKGSCWIRGALSGPDDGQADTVGAGEGHQRFRLGEVGWQVRSDLRGAGVTRRTEDPGNARVAGERPGQGMFPGPVSKHEDFHG